MENAIRSARVEEKRGLALARPIGWPLSGVLPV
jgi:hypothetical protein